MASRTINGTGMDSNDVDWNLPIFQVQFCSVVYSQSIGEL